MSHDTETRLLRFIISALVLLAFVAAGMSLVTGGGW